jgi:tRNA(Ile2) C34 agmatinyltransferase TiaS
MSFLEKAKENLTDKALSLWTGAVGTLLLFVGGVILAAALPTLNSPTFQKLLLPLLGLSVLANTGLIATVWLLVRRHKLRPGFGVLWDSKFEPHCPACETLLSAYGRYEVFGWGWHCTKCKKSIALQNEVGVNIRLQEAIMQLKARK